MKVLTKSWCGIITFSSGSLQIVLCKQQFANPTLQKVFPCNGFPKAIILLGRQVNSPLVFFSPGVQFDLSKHLVEHFVSKAEAL
jgi:hypothetical protein